MCEIRSKNCNEPHGVHAAFTTLGYFYPPMDPFGERPPPPLRGLTNRKHMQHAGFLLLERELPNSSYASSNRAGWQVKDKTEQPPLGSGVELANEQSAIGNLPVLSAISPPVYIHVHFFSDKKQLWNHVLVVNTSVENHSGDSRPISPSNLILMSHMSVRLVCISPAPLPVDTLCEQRAR